MGSNLRRGGRGDQSITSRTDRGRLLLSSSRKRNGVLDNRGIRTRIFDYKTSGLTFSEPGRRTKAQQLIYIALSVCSFIRFLLLYYVMYTSIHINFQY